MSSTYSEPKAAFDKLRLGKHDTNRYLKAGAKLAHEAHAARDLANFRELVKEGKASPKIRRLPS